VNRDPAFRRLAHYRVKAVEDFKRRNTMSEDNKIEQEVKASELSEQALDNVAGGAATPVPAAPVVPVETFGAVHGSRSNIKNNIVSN
jgi:hypothetical protein